ncbi:hypothetical protein GCM10010320_80190 [Streptomyces caelestis]|jgi:hypothetical protein|uniref:Uncharacterized protein n=1 Tax=Streptomyces caelestis TaxID=36816 RepID=A0A7W9HD61_9ACTN|nr:hypothetical protein [Streptomyces caelestis]GGW86573.1 hypothetical protein GCM10010320_80190 [Streptomyces caelestis]
MAVMMCSRRGCDRLLSVSRVPGGNPVARSDPEHWAVVFWHCAGCRAYFCDRCVTRRVLRRPVCVSCAGVLAKPDIETLLN